MLKMKNIITILGIILALLFLIAIPQADVISDFKVLGRVDNQQVLQSASINEKNPAVFSFNDSGDPSFILMLNGPRKIKNVKMYFPKGFEPGSLTLEIGDDLFTWKKATGPLSHFFLTNDGAIYGADMSGAGLTGTFLRFVLEKGLASQVRIAGIFIFPDTLEPLKIVRMEKVKLEDNSVTLRFNTDVESVGSVRFGENINDLKDGPMMINFSKEHVIKVDGLLKGTDYWFIGIGQDSVGTIKYSVPVRLRTSGIPLPLITKLEVNQLESSSFFLDIDFNIPVRTEVEYGYDPSRLLRKNFSKNQDKSRIHFSNLKPESLIYYRITIVDKEGNKSISKIMEVRTEPMNILSQSKISGDFVLVGENLNPYLKTGEEKRFYDKDFSYMTGSLMSGNIFQNSQKLIIEFPKIVKLSRLDLVWWALIYSSSANISVSRDGSSWEKVSQGLSPETGIILEQAGRSPHLVTRISLNRDLRFIKCEFDQGVIQRRFKQYNNIRLLEVYAIPNHPITGTISVNSILK